MAFKQIDDKSIIDIILKVAGYTYGPLLGLFAFGILTKRSINDRQSLIVCLVAPILVFIVDLVNNAEWFIAKMKLPGAFAGNLKALSADIFDGYKIGVELLLINGLFTFIGLWIISKKKPSTLLTN